MDREVGITEEGERFLKTLDHFGEFVLAGLWLLGVVFFVNGFRFLNPFDTIFRFAFGGFVIVATSRHFYRQYQRWRLERNFWRQLR